MNPTPGIHRALMPFESDYFIAPNAWMRDPNLSFKAKGLLAYFMTHQAGYVITFNQIVAQTSDGKSAIRSAIEELVTNGYLLTERTVNERGFNAGMSYTLVNPSTSLNSRWCENPTLENPTLENRNAYKKNNSIKEEQLIKELSPQIEFEESREQKKHWEDFVKFYAVYPHKTGKKDAYKAFLRALKDASFDEIMAGVVRFANDPNLPRLKNKIKHPATWLNKGCWDDEPLAPPIYTIDELKQIQALQNRQMRDKDKEATAAMLREEKERRARLDAPESCEHRPIKALCNVCR